MQVTIVLSALIAIALAGPINPDADAVVVKSDFDNIGVGEYNYLFETSNGIGASEQGQLRNAGTDDESIAVQGRFRYTGADGVVYEVNYVADENGFQPQGAHLPTAK